MPMHALYKGDVASVLLWYQKRRM